MFQFRYTPYLLISAAYISVYGLRLNRVLAGPNPHLNSSGTVVNRQTSQPDVRMQDYSAGDASALGNARAAAEPSSQLAQLRFKLFRFTMGSAVLCVMIVTVLLFGVTAGSRDDTLRFYILLLFVYRLIEVCWVMEMLLTFWPTAATRSAIAPTAPLNPTTHGGRTTKVPLAQQQQRLAWDAAASSFEPQAAASGADSDVPASPAPLANV